MGRDRLKIYDTKKADIPLLSTGSDNCFMLLPPANTQRHRKSTQTIYQRPSVSIGVRYIKNMALLNLVMNYVCI
ncbi:hypothetical protein, partial [Fischerella thermalis]|uniref:hypothetical protein n=1 Tax=Fischerella thermalis TaxID=372787 RepID=UPI001CA5D38F